MMARWAKNKRLIVAAGAVLVTLLLAGSVVVAQNQMQTEGDDSAAPQQPVPDAQVLKNSDQRLAEAAALVPGFGGIRSDRNDNDIIYVYMLDPSQQEEAEKAAQNFLGAERWSRTKEVRVLQGQYTVSQLRDWYSVVHSRIREIFSDLPYHGIKWSGVSEGRNRIFVAVSNGEAKALVEAELGRLGVPREAVIVEVNDTPIEFWSHKELDSDVDQVVGGLQVVVAQNQMQTEGDDSAAPQQPVPDAQVLKNSDQRLAEAAALVPGFGGIRSDRNDNDIIYVYMLDPSQQEEAEKAARSFMGAERWSRTKEVRVLQGQYTVSQLRGWYAVVRSRIWEIVSDLPRGAISRTGISEGRNRISIVVYTKEAKALIEAELEKLGVPLEAVIIDLDDLMWFRYLSHEALSDDVAQRGLQSAWVTCDPAFAC